MRPLEIAMMLPEQNDSCEIDALISEYLDSDPGPTRLAELSKLLENREDCREQFVAQVQIHGMLCDYFETGKAKAAQPVAEPSVADVVVDAMPPRRRRKRRGRPNAA